MKDKSSTKTKSMLKNWAKSLAIVTLLSSILSSCGVIFGGSKFSGIVIAKDHPKAQIFTNGKKIGKGTASGHFPRNKPLTVELQQEGCENKIQTFNKTFRVGNFILSFGIWSVFGVTVDLVTGACFKPDHIHDSSIQRANDKNFVFTVDYSDCPQK